RRPAQEHPVRRRGAEEKAPGLFPGEAPGLRHALVGLRSRELTERSVVRLVAPDARGLGQHRILARFHPRVVRPPPAAVDDDLVADLDVAPVLGHPPPHALPVTSLGLRVLLPQRYPP